MLMEDIFERLLMGVLPVVRFITRKLCLIRPYHVYKELCLDLLVIQDTEATSVTSPTSLAGIEPEKLMAGTDWHLVRWGFSERGFLRGTQSTRGVTILEIMT
ncbi:hypothetical protein AVEN_87765-1 [Araneus ventricosus]|uniref:Uncharacterized protein n=1 Tax=Araneus ventricosus TaxID=182803 RepID=A0A4Y2QNE4_ARAVE|nr:hypothetical protein AVEN_130060-1 [Araneus ventricosus]GBN64859.1 hypothetical protein AVEN_87765-1 [Araneus ventricosus]